MQGFSQTGVESSEKKLLMIQDSKTRFGLISVLLHWTVATAVIALLFIGFVLVDPLPRGQLRSFYLNIHVGIGVIATPFILARLWWRVRNGKPKAPTQHPVLMMIANIVWRILLAALVIQLVSGPMIVWLHNHPLKVFGLFQIPPPFQATLKKIATWDRPFAAVHYFVAWFIVCLVGLHIVGALKHFFINRDQLVQRMVWPFTRDEEASTPE